MALRDSSAPVDGNDFPGQPQRHILLRGPVILWLVAISCVILLVPLYFVAATLRKGNARLEADLQAFQVALASGSMPEPEVQALMDELAQVQAATDEIEEVYSTLGASHINWPAAMIAIGNYNSSQLALASVVQSDIRVTLNGRAIDDSVVIGYSRALEQSGLFSRVVVQSVRLMATPFASPAGTAVEPGATATVTSTTTVTPTATPTPAPDPADQYEVDDFTPVVIFLGQPQSHNFYPLYDVDKVQFLAKAGRYYRISTADLSVGVDTFLTVIVGGATYTNDDHKPGDLSSVVTFQAGAGGDVQTIVKVTNRGEYSPDSWYQVTVEEIIPTPVPTPTPTSLPDPTVTPENTSTPTPDLRDVYEPDDTTPKPIAIGETQPHNFYPNDDVDQAEFLAKAGRYYRVSTSDLSRGVDTFLAVSVGDATYTNDDREPGDLSSEIVFQSGTGDVYARVSATNRGQYGPDNWYQLTVEEIVPTPTPAPTETPTNTLSSSLRLPGVASLASSFALADLQITAGRAGAVPRPWASEGSKAWDVLSPTAVEFVIVLEFKAGSP